MENIFWTTEKFKCELCIRQYLISFNVSIMIMSLWFCESFPFIGNKCRSFGDMSWFLQFPFWLFIKCVCDKIWIICEYGWGLWVYIVLIFFFSFSLILEKYDMKGLETVRKLVEIKNVTLLRKMIKLTGRHENRMKYYVSKMEKPHISKVASLPKIIVRKC